MQQNKLKFQALNKQTLTFSKSTIETLETSNNKHDWTPVN